MMFFCSDSTNLGAGGAIHSNSSVVRLWYSAEPVTSPSSPSTSSQLLQQFSDDLATIRMRVALLLQALDMDLVDEQGAPTAVAQLAQVGRTTDPLTIQLAEAMSGWVGEVVESWVQYYHTLSQLKAGVDTQAVAASQEAVGSDDMCQAVAMWDIKMAQEMRVVMDTLLVHYIMLEGTLQEVTAAAAEPPIEADTTGMYN